MKNETECSGSCELPRVRRIYRWKSFWLGILTLCFVGWAWVRSMTWNDAACEWFDGQYYTIGQGSGAFYLVIQPRESVLSHTPNPTRGVGTPWRREKGQPWLRPAFETKSSPTLQRYWVAHWVILLLLLCPWAAFLSWRLYRIHQDRPSLLNP